LLRSLVLLVIGALFGAALFHFYYVGLGSEARCGWDHPLDDHAKALCREPAPVATTPGYGRKARHDLDGLIENVSN
jgi:hypothetical protein